MSNDCGHLKSIAAKVVTALSVVLCSPAVADVVVGSWNLKHLGWSNGKNFEALGEIGNTFDLLAIQEVMSEEGAERLHAALENASGESWGYAMSHLIGRSSYKEAYAFYWRESEVASAGGDVVFFDGGDVFAREPYSALFQDTDTGETFVLANVHILYGDGVGDRLPEIQALADYWQWLGNEAYPNLPRILAGDFNLDNKHLGFDALEALDVQTSFTDGRGTTISPTPGRYPNHYDHLFISDTTTLNVTSQGVLRFPEAWGIAHGLARDTISDHVPVWIGLNGATLERAEILNSVDIEGISSQIPSCIDINSSSQADLQRLPHISESRGEDIIEGRPWTSVGQLTDISGVSQGRAKAIQMSGLLCD